MTTKLSDAAVDLVREQLGDLFLKDVHAKRVLSLTNATVGVLRAGALGVHAIGVGLAREMDLSPKHAIKQVDRLLSNDGIQPWDLFEHWVPFVLGTRSEALVALDWTDFDNDGQTTLMLHLVSSHGRSTPLVWKTVKKKELGKQQTRIETDVIARFLEIAPPGMKVTLLADRGFADQKLYSLLEEIGCDYVIRMRGNIAVENERGETRPVKEWVPKDGKSIRIPNARVTVQGRTPVPAVVCLRAPGMKDNWCLATSRADLRAGDVVQLYSRRFTIEEACDLAARASRAFSGVADARDGLADAGLPAEASAKLSEIGVQLREAQAHVQAHGANLLINLLRGKNAQAAQFFIKRCEAYQRRREKFSRVIAVKPDADCIELIDRAAEICERMNLSTVDPETLGDELQNSREFVQTARLISAMLAPVVNRRPESITVFPAIAGSAPKRLSHSP